MVWHVMPFTVLSGSLGVDRPIALWVHPGEPDMSQRPQACLGGDFPSVQRTVSGEKKYGDELRLDVTKSRAISCAENNNHGNQRLEDLWRQFFSDPSQWWDHRTHKSNPRYPDFKHKEGGVGLWIDGRYNPSWVGAGLASMTPGSVSRSVYSWNSMISESMKSDRGQDALELYKQMQAEGVEPDSFTFTRVLNACASLEALEEGKRIHAHLIESGCESDVFVASTLVDMYAKCGSIKDAEKVFYKMPVRDVVSWNVMLAAFVKYENGKKALELFRQMQAEGTMPDSVTFVGVLKACASIMALEEGRRVHRQVVQSGYVSEVFVGSALVDMYAKCGSIEDAHKVFHDMPTRDVVAWSAMLTGYVNCGQGQKALELFSLMQEEGVKPDPVTFVVVLNACTSTKVLEYARRVHAQIIWSGCESNTFVASTLVDMYATCGSIEDAERVFHLIHRRSRVSWNSMLAGYVKCDEGHKALELFWQMQEEGVKPDTITFRVVLNACASVVGLDEGRRVHTHVIESGYESDLFVESALVDMYGKCGSIEDAQRVFYAMTTRDVVSWNAMLAGHVKCEEGQKALELFQVMQAEGMKPDYVTLSVLLNACASIMALEEGRRVHAYVIQSSYQSNVFVGNTLVDMYAKCGSIEDAQRVFYSMPTHDAVSWNAMLSAYAMHGHGKEALELFQEMYRAGVEMNLVTFVSILSACSHGGLVEEGIQLFESMDSVYGITPTVDHFVCMVDLFGRAGRLDEAEHLLRREPKLSKDQIALMALLAACRNHHDVEMGERIAQEVLEFGA